MSWSPSSASTLNFGTGNKILQNFFYLFAMQIALYKKTENILQGKNVTLE